MELKNNPFFFTFIWVYTDCLKQKRVVGESLTNTHTNHGVSRKNATFFSVSSFNRQSFCTSFSVVAHGIGLELDHLSCSMIHERSRQHSEGCSLMNCSSFLFCFFHFIFA